MLKDGSASRLSIFWYFEKHIYQILTIPLGLLAEYENQI